MTPTPSSSKLEPSSIILDQAASVLAHSVPHSGVQAAEGDDRSSSLSDLGDRAGNEDLNTSKVALVHGSDPVDGSDPNDTEAETERLEVSPQRTRKHRNVIVSSSNHVLTNGTEPFATRILPVNEVNMGSLNGKVDPMSEISSLIDSGDETGGALLLLSPSSKKRKRLSFKDSHHSGTESENAVSGRYSRVLDNGSLSLPGPGDNEVNSAAYPMGEDQRPDGDGTSFLMNNTDGINSKRAQSAKPKSKKGKRKVKKVRDDNTRHSSPLIPDIEVQSDQADNMEGDYSNGEEAGIEDAVDDAEIDAAAKNEEGLVKKKSAMDSLNAIEKCFATLRDKLFDEKLAQYNEELAMLNQPNPTHPDYIMLKKVVDKHRDEKIQYEQTLLKFKLSALQKKAIAEKAQIHAQYMQNVRDIRETTLEQLQKESYQLQRERRNAEGDVPDYSYRFPTKRSQQIRNQTAYNAEVSILSGIAKYVGFPSAPKISAARPSEIEDDLHAMGINAQPLVHTQTLPATMRVTMSGGVGFPQQKFAAEEQFLERNPWANAQHPAHHQHQQLHRPTSGASRPHSPLSTPASQRRILSLNGLHGSASTIADLHSGPTSSVAPTPMTGEKAAPAAEHYLGTQSDNRVTSTPSKRGTLLPESATPTLAAHGSVGGEKIKPYSLGTGMQQRASSTLRNPARRNEPLSDLSRPTRLADTSNAPLGTDASTSTPMKYSIVKAEDSPHSSRQTPSLQFHHTPLTANTPLKGQVDRIGA